jgi:hypothetical protein
VFVGASGAGVDRYLQVFREIFHRTSHEGHYNMMMGVGKPGETVETDKPQETMSNRDDG